MHAMRPFATDVPEEWCVYQPVNLPDTCLRPAKTAEQIRVLLEVETLASPMNTEFGGILPVRKEKGENVAQCAVYKYAIPTRSPDGATYICDAAIAKLL